MRRVLYRLLFRFLGVDRLYREIVESDRLHNVKSLVRSDLTEVLSNVDQNNPFFRGKFTEFLRTTQDVDDAAFFERYGQLPVFSKQDYVDAGAGVMPEHLAKTRHDSELQFDGKPFAALQRLRRGDFLMPMATGGSTSLPLKVYMTKHHMFSMLFTFFKCWYRMGWKPGDKMLVFYPMNTYNIDDMVKFNPYSRITGFHYELFDQIDEPTIRRLVSELNRFRPKLLLVFPSPMNMIAHAIEKYDLPLKHHPELINVSGETFFDCQRQNIQSVFTGSKIEDSYGSVELGEIAHETERGLEAFANVSYIETIANDDNMPEMVVTRLGLNEFPFIRYKMKDIAHVDFYQDAGQEQFVMSKIEGKDTNYLLSHNGRRLYPSFFNELVNHLNQEFDNEIIEIKVYERDQRELEIQLITRTEKLRNQISDEVRRLLTDSIGDQMRYDVRFVEFIEHDYRKKYRVIERLGDVEYAGGIVGDENKLAGIT